MKKEEKEILYELLKTADASLNGYTRECFAGEIVFLDDEAAVSVVDSVVESVVESDGASVVDQTVASHQDEKNTSLTLSALNDKILRCTRCGLARTRNNVVPGQGVEHPQVLVIGEGPGYDEDMQGLPFVGKAGALLDKMLAAISLDRKTNCYIANIVKCRPPENRDPFPDEQSACISFLEAQIHLLKPKMILCMGRVAGHKLLNIETPMNEMHGKLYDYNGIPVMVTYHPSALLRNVDLKKPAWEDLKRFRAQLNQCI